MASFSTILDRPASSVERPKPLPTGTYTCIVKGLPRFDKSSKKQTEFVEFTLQPVSAGEDVDAEALEEMGGYITRTIRATYYLTEDALWRLKKFLTEDLEIEDDGRKSIGQMIDETPGRQVLAAVKHRASEDGQTVYAELSSTAPVA